MSFHEQTDGGSIFGSSIVGSIELSSNDYLLYQKLFVGFISLAISLIFGLLPSHLSHERSRQASGKSSNDVDLNNVSHSDDKNKCRGERNYHTFDEERDNDYINHGDDGNEDFDPVPTALPAWLSLATSFGGGVFLGAACLHLLPEASSVLDRPFSFPLTSSTALNKREIQEFPRANLVCCLGFLMVLALEEFMGSYSSSMNTPSSSNDCDTIKQMSENDNYNKQCEAQISCKGYDPIVPPPRNNSSSTRDNNGQYSPIENARVKMQIQNKITSDSGRTTFFVSKQTACGGSDDFSVRNFGGVTTPSSVNENSDIDTSNNRSITIFNNDENGIAMNNRSATSSSVALVVALSFHSLFDGLAIGSVTSFAQLHAVSIAVLAHKPISAFALGSILVGKKMMLRTHHHDKDHVHEEQGEQHQLQEQNGSGGAHPSRVSMYYYFKYACVDCQSTICNDECQSTICNDECQFSKGNERSRSHTTPCCHDESNEVKITNAATTPSSYQSHQGKYVESRHTRKQTPPSTSTGTKQSQKLPLFLNIRSIPMDIFLYMMMFSLSSFLGTIVGACGLSLLDDGSSMSGLPSKVDFNEQSVTKDTSNPTKAAIVAAIFQSLAAGTFMYAATIEALARERSDHHHYHHHHSHILNSSHDGDHHHDQQHRHYPPRPETKRVGAAFIGVVTMAAIKMLEADDNGN